MGTFRKNKKHLLPTFIDTKNRKINFTIFGFHTSIMSTSNKNSLLISSMPSEDNFINEQTREKQKPPIILFYNITKGGVDIVDELCGTYSRSQKTAH